MEIKFQLKTDFINLTQLLKAAHVISSGSDAHYLIETGEVKVNGKTDTRKRAKLYEGDYVEIYDKKIIIER
jgi:ribosome-associated protein